MVLGRRGFHPDRGVEETLQRRCGRGLVRLCCAFCNAGKVVTQQGRQCSALGVVNKRPEPQIAPREGLEAVTPAMH